MGFMAAVANRTHENPLHEPARRRPRGAARRSRRWALALALLLPTALSGVALAQDAFTQMRDLLQRGHYNSAAQLNGPALVRDNPDSAEAHYLYARALYLTGNPRQARVQLDAALALAGNDLQASYVNLNGLLRLSEGDAEGALRAMENAFVRTGSYEYAMDWGRVAWEVGAYEQALEAFATAAATERGQREPWPQLDRGRVLLLLDRPADAVPALEAAIDAFEASDPGGPRPPSPAYVEAFYRLGEAYEQLGALEQAEASYRSATSADPNYTPARTALDRLSRRLQ